MNTEKVAKAMAQAMDADLCRVSDADPKMLSDYDLIGFGSGIYYFKHHKSLFDFIENLPNQGKKAFVFSTSGIPIKIQHRKLRFALVQKGFAVKDEFTCPGFENYGLIRLIGGFRRGRPNAGDLEKAGIFAKELGQATS